MWFFLFLVWKWIKTYFVTKLEQMLFYLCYFLVEFMIICSYNYIRDIYFTFFSLLRKAARLIISSTIRSEIYLISSYLFQYAKRSGRGFWSNLSCGRPMFPKMFERKLFNWLLFRFAKSHPLKSLIMLSPNIIMDFLIGYFLFYLDEGFFYYFL